MPFEVNLKDATRQNELSWERLIALVKREYTLWEPTAACCLMKSVFGPPKLGDIGNIYTEVIGATCQLVLERTRAHDKLNVVLFWK